MEKNRHKYLIKNAIIFTIGNLGSKLLSFFLIPLYTNILTTSQYGIIDLISTICTVTVPILTLNICESVMRFSLDKGADKEEITKIGTIILIVSTILGIILIPLCTLFHQISNYSFYIYFYVVSLAASQLYLCDLRGKELLLRYSIGNIIQTALIAFLNIIFLFFMQMGTKGYLMAYIFSNFFVALYAFFVGRSYKAFGPTKIRKEKMVAMIKYSIVLIPNTFMWWIMNASDRIMVTALVGASANGIYAISYKLPTLVSTLASIFNQAWTYSAIREEGSKDETEYNNKIFQMLICVVMLIGIGMLSFAKPFLKIYVADTYFSAWKYLPFLTVGCVYLTLGTFMATSYTVHKDSFGYLFSGSFGAAFNIALNYLLIPLIGVYGAAIATCISYIAVFVFRLFHTRKYIKYNIINKGFIMGSILLLVSAGLMFMDNTIGLVIQVCICIISTYLYSYVWFPVFKIILKRIRIK